MYNNYLNTQFLILFYILLLLHFSNIISIRQSYGNYSKIYGFLIDDILQVVFYLLINIFVEEFDIKKNEYSSIEVYVLQLCLT